MLLGPDGKTIDGSDALPNEETMAGWRKEVEDALDTPEVQLMGEALIFGHQLANWGRFYIEQNEDISPQAKTAIINLLISNVYDPATGRPQLYTATNMINALEDLLPRVKERVVAEAKAADEAAAAENNEDEESAEDE
jgi:hypothetical protein